MFIRNPYQLLERGPNRGFFYSKNKYATACVILSIFSFLVEIAAFILLQSSGFASTTSLAVLLVLDILYLFVLLLFFHEDNAASFFDLLVVGGFLFFYEGLFWYEIIVRLVIVTLEIRPLPGLSRRDVYSETFVETLRILTMLAAIVAGLHWDESQSSRVTTERIIGSSPARVLPAGSAIEMGHSTSPAVIGVPTSSP